MIKRLLALSLVLILSIESFAAVVGDNDGAAFITKAEFDSLKSSFQAQIDKYNTSLDNKIDGAIAAYIDGIKISPTSTVPLPLLNWGSVTSFNKPYVNTFTYPSFNLFATKAFIPDGLGTSNEFHDSTGQYYDRDGVEWHLGSVWLKCAYTNSATTKKCLVTGVKENETSNHKPVWSGITSGWSTKIDISGTGQAASNLYAIEINNATYPPGFLFSNTAILKAYQNFSNAGQMYGGIWAYFQAYNASPMWSKYNYSSQDTWGLFSSATCQITTTDPTYEHIVSYNNTDDWHLYSKDWTKTLKNDSNNSLTCDNFFSQISSKISGRFNYTKQQPDVSVAKITYNTDGTKTYTQAIYSNRNSVLINEKVTANNKTVEQAGQSTVKLPDVGYVGGFTPNKIYQIDSTKKIQQYLGADLYELAAPTLNQGFVLGYAKAGDEITWTPVFTTRHFGGHDSILSNSNAVKIWISSTPFTTAHSGTLIQTENESGNKDTVQYSSYSGSDYSKSQRKLKWKMQNDGWMYVMWSVNLDDATLLSSIWDVTLDLTQCGFYLRTPEG